MAPPAAAPLRRQLDGNVFEQVVCKVFDIFGVVHDVKTTDGEAVDLDMDVRHVLNHLLAEQEALFRQWQFEETRHCEERLDRLDRSWQSRCKRMQRMLRGSVGSAETQASLEPEKAKEVEVKATEDQTNTAAQEEARQKMTTEEGARRRAAEEEVEVKATENQTNTAAQEEARQKLATEEGARRRAAEEEAKRLAAEEERKKASEKEDARREAAGGDDENAQSDRLDFKNLYAKAEEATEEPQARQDSGEKFAPEYVCRTGSGKDLEATPSRKDDASKRSSLLASSTPATSPSKSPLISARGTNFTPKRAAESPPARPGRGVVSEGIARLMGKFTGSSR